jgi:two-component system cell cycle response regulator DivK
MSFPLRSERPASVRDEARMLAERAGDHKNHLDALVLFAETRVRHAEAALSRVIDATHGDIDRLHSLLDAQLHQRLVDVETAKRLCLESRDQRVAADRLVSLLDDPGADELYTELRRDAVLVADDYGDVREMLAEVLQHAGFVVGTASNGLEALFAAYVTRPAVIVMDLTMPVLDGVEATRLLKTADATCRARVIAYTGNGLLGPAQNLFDGILHKPTTPQVVVATVQHFANL